MPPEKPLFSRAAESPLLGTSDLDVYPLSLGGNTFGWTTDQAASFTVLDAYAAARLREWVAAAQAGGWPLPVALQPHYNLVARQPYESDLAPLVAGHGLGVTPYFALAAGFLTGKYRTQEDLKGPARGQMAGRYFSLAVLSAMDDVAAAHGVELASVAIAWLLAKPGVIAPIASVTSPAQLAALTAGAALKLPDDEVAALAAG